MLATSLPAWADAPPADLFGGLPVPNHLRKVEDPDAFLKASQSRTFVQVASLRSKESAEAVVRALRKIGVSAAIYTFRGGRFFVPMVKVTSRDQMRKVLADVRRMGYSDAFARNYNVRVE